MKRLTVTCLLIIAAAISGCNGKNSETTTTDHGHENAQQEMLKANREVYRAIETGDTVTLRKYITANAIDHGAGPNGEDIKGDEIVKNLATVHNDIDNLKFEVLEEAANDDHIFALVRMTGTTNKAVWGMPANFKIDSKSIDLLKIKDGKLEEHWGFFEMAEMMKMVNSGNATGADSKLGEGKK